MKIKSITFENFRNFKEKGTIDFSTDGKVSIIYGMNGDGKTTLHQLFQWIFYGEVHFNKTTSDILYNLSYESEIAVGKEFSVTGTVDFENNGVEFSLTRTAKYVKELSGSRRVMPLLPDEELYMQRKEENNNWVKVDEDPVELIEMFLPRGLSEYFFFDGETMIADLSVKGKDSAAKLRKAIYSMFELDILEAAISHIGTEDLKSTAIGKLYIDKGKDVSEPEITQIKNKILGAQDAIERCKNGIKRLQEANKSLRKKINDISEKIGKNKTKKDYETQRQSLIKERDALYDNVDSNKKEFGDYVIDTIPQLLIGTAVEKAKLAINLQIGKNELPDGLNPTLIKYLLDNSHDKCICGRSLTDEIREYIKEWTKYLPPDSYAQLYNNFTLTAQVWSNGFDKNKIETYVKNAIVNIDMAAEKEIQIKLLDEEAKNSPDIQEMVEKRIEYENEIQDNNSKITDLDFRKKKAEAILNKEKKRFDELTKNLTDNKLIERKINILEKVKKDFVKKLEDAAVSYSGQLQKNIQDLVDKMLTSKRKVTVSKDFAVRVYDSHDNESKSEGQFAVVSFAYIGGILDMLKNEKNLVNKEYPLVLDGPFSKLDKEQRANVINVIPQLAPQIILFSKDNLQNLIPNENLGYVWTIKSNEEKNIAEVRSGFLWK